MPQGHPKSEQNSQSTRGTLSTEEEHSVQKQNTQYTDESPDCRLGSICSCCLEGLLVAVDPSLWVPVEPPRLTTLCCSPGLGTAELPSLPTQLSKHRAVPSTLSDNF